MERRTHGRIFAGFLALTAAAGMPMAAATLVLGTAATTASAQVLPVTAWNAFVSSDDAVLRCGHGDLMYPVANLKRGQILRVDGEGQGWARVSYPAGVPVFVPADAVQVDPATRSATLSKPSRLKAFNATTGLRGSWKDVFEQALPAGTKFSVVDAEPTPDGRGNTAWRIVPPESARAFVPLSAFRRATPEEVEQFKVAQAANPPAIPPQSSTAERPATTPPAATPVTTADNAPTRSLAEPMVQPTPAAQPVPQPTPAAQTPPAQVERPAAPVRRPTPPAQRNRYDRLEAAFEAVRNQSSDEAEFSELLAEFESALASLDDSPQSQGVRHRLQQRIAFLKLRADLQAQRRRFAEMEASLSEDDQRLAEKLAEVDRTRQYTIVGRLSASTIYDGERLPLMYRIQTVGGPAPRTVAYVRPDDTLKIETRLGQIVGVVGDATMDPTLRLNIITPTRLDALEATATAGVDTDNP